MFELERRHQLILLVVAAALLFGAGYKYALVRGLPVTVNESLVTDKSGMKTIVEPEKESREIAVHVAGAVQRPGVYYLPAGSRVVDAITMAGPTGDSALDYLNLAALLEDGRQISVPSLEGIRNQQPAGYTSPARMDAAMPVAAVPGAGPGGGSGLININTAGQAELQKLPGIGPALSQRIIDYRTKNGPFLSIEDIQAVSGIGEKRFEQIRDMISVY